MKILMTGPDNNPAKSLGGIVTVVNIILNNSSQGIDYFNRDLGTKNKGITLFKKLILFRKTIRKNKYQGVHFHFSFDKISLCREILFLFVASIHRVPIIIHLHGGILLFEKKKSPLIPWIFSKASKILVLSEIEKKSVCALYNLPEDGVSVLRNCIDLKEIPEIKETGSANNTLIFFGRLHKSKGIEDLLEALKKLKSSPVPFKAEVCGTGPEKDWFIPEMQQSIGSSFEYKGLVWGEKKWQTLNDADIFLLPSRYGEGLPMALLEAMALGKVVIVTDDASITQVVKDNVNGLLVKKNSPEQLADKIQSILSNHSLRKTLGRNARKTIQEQYSSDSYIRQLDAIYASV